MESAVWRTASRRWVDRSDWVDHLPVALDPGGRAWTLYHPVPNREDRDSENHPDASGWRGCEGQPCHHRALPSQPGEDVGKEEKWQQGTFNVII